MSNGDEYWSQGNHGGNYSNTYSLWGSSKFYDINNLSPQNYFANARSSPKHEDYQASACAFDLWPGGGTVAEAQDSRNRRIIKKETLLEDPDTFYKHDEGPANSSPDPGPYWTAQYWQKEGAIWGGLQESTSLHPVPMPCKQLKKEAMFQEQLNKSLAQPVKMTKAESMMQRMGWQGGALGKTGEGIVEPIVPNVIYATKIGFGLYQPKQLSPGQLQKKQKLDSKQVFDMNVMLNILEFVKNNSEIELLFDKSLTSNERKRVHYLVNEVLNAEDLALASYSSAGAMELALQVSDHNCFVLVTQSEGEKPDRSLCLFKLPPSHVYLIIPDDLREGTSPAAREQRDAAPEQPQVDPDEDTNPFLRSITRNLKNCNTEETQCEDSCNHDHKSLNKILEFFSEFAVKDEFTVFRYLGPFDQEEWEGFDAFLDLGTKYLKGDIICEKYSQVFKKTLFEINTDVNGHSVIYKKMGADKKS